MNLLKIRTTAGTATINVLPAEGTQRHELSRRNATTWLLLNMDLVTYDETLMRQRTMFLAWLSI
jgi:hypothetical protein